MLAWGVIWRFVLCISDEVRRSCERGESLQSNFLKSNTVWDVKKKTEQRWEGSSLPNPFPWTTNKSVSTWFSEEFSWFRLLNLLMWWVQGAPVKTRNVIRVGNGECNDITSCVCSNARGKKSNTKGQHEMNGQVFNGKNKRVAASLFPFSFPPPW